MKGGMRGRGWSHRDWFNKYSGLDVVDCATRDGVSFLAIQTDSGITAALANWRWIPLGHHSWYSSVDFEWEITMESELSWGVTQAMKHCPQRILDMLSPVCELWPDEKSERDNAKAWRVACQEYRIVQAEKPAVKKGDVVYFSSPINFTDGLISHDMLFQGGSTFQRLDGSRGSYLLKRWRERSYSVSSHGEWQERQDDDDVLDSLLG